MAVLQSGNSPGTRIAAGDSVLHAAQHLDTTPIANRLEEFRTAHVGYLRANRAVKRAAVALQRKQAEVGAADVDQDAAVLVLASVLPGDGLPRQNPFKPLGAPAPAVLCALGHEDEAKAVLALESAVQRQRGLSEASLDAAKNAGRAARRVQKAVAPLEKLEEARALAVAKRDALAQIWESAFAGLKRGARAAEDEGARGLFAALFERRVTKASSSRGRKPSGGGTRANRGAVSAVGKRMARQRVSETLAKALAGAASVEEEG